MTMSDLAANTRLYLWLELLYGPAIMTVEAFQSHCCCCGLGLGAPLAKGLSLRYSEGTRGTLGLCAGPLVPVGRNWVWPAADGALNLAFSLALSLLPPVNRRIPLLIKLAEASVAVADVGVVVLLLGPVYDIVGVK